MYTELQYKIITSIIKQYDTDGHSPYLAFTNDIEKFVLKIPNSILDKESITKEFLCSFLLNCWSVNHTPEIAALSLSLELYESSSVISDKRFAISPIFFGSKHIENAIDLQDFIIGKNKYSLNRVNNLGIFYLIAIFDIWVENDDRKPSNNNLLFKPIGTNFELSPIDNALTFASMSLADLNSDFVSFSDNDSILYTPFGRSLINQDNIDSNWIEDFEKKFYLCISKSKESFQQICNTLPEGFKLNISVQEKLYHFLFNENRNRMVFEQFRYIINSIK
jgi:hypothetical protein